VSSPPAAEPSAKGTILVVDDTDFIRRIIGAILASEGYRALEAANGGEALRLFALHSQEIVAVILDLNMPETDGRETLASLSQSAPFLPILIVSGLPLDGLQGRIPGTPGVGYVSKPFTQARLLEGLQKVIDEMKPRRASSG
jgi:two-component system cell cycle sensor histidine kinase/response regulator CckA